MIRAKGIVALGDSPDIQTIVQMVGRCIQVRRGATWGAMPRETRLVVIGSPEALTNAELARRSTPVSTGRSAIGFARQVRCYATG